MQNKKPLFGILLGFLLSISLLNESLAQTTFTVTNTNDAGSGSFRQAILDANSTANLNASTPDIINFNISGTGPFTISPTSALPFITDPVIIDGYSQPGASPGTLLIVINGASTPANTDGLTITGGSSTVQGLVINGFTRNGVVLQSNGNTLKGNFIGTDANGTNAAANGNYGVFLTSASENLVGGSIIGSGNLISGNTNTGIYIFNGSSNKMLGNKIGTNITGTAAVRNQDGIIIQNSPHNVVGGHITVERNLISGNTADGIFLSDAGATEDTIMGNYIGTDVTGTLDLGNGADGVSIGYGGHHNYIGGTTIGERNIISGNNRFGIYFFGTGTVGNHIIGNYIGTDVSGTNPLGNSRDGVLLYPDGGNIVGGTRAGEGNIISGNGRAGVDVVAGGNNNNPILGNSVFGNTGLGIDLSATAGIPGEADGLTPNDPGDADVGANNLQNFPVITSTQVIGNGDVSVTYSVPSAVGNSAYPLRIEFFLSDGGQGRTFLGAQSYSSANAQLSVTQTFTPNALVSPGDKITATATDANGNTSEFPGEVQAPSPPLFSKQFSPDVITAGENTTLTFTIDNTSNTLAATSLDFTDNLPAGVVVASPANASVVCTGGTLTATAGSSTISYTGGTISAGSSCTLQVDVTSATFGTYINTTGELTSSLGNSSTATDTLTVNRAGSYDIYAYNVKNCTVQRVTFINDADEYNPSFAPGAMNIVHDVLGGSAALGHSLYITDISTGVSVPLTGGEGGNDASWSPDSMYIAFDRTPVGDQSIYIVPSTGGTPTLIRNNAVDVEWSNNSQRLVFQDVTDGSIRTVDLSGGSETTIVSSGANPSWSTNGKYIAYTDGNNIWKIKVSESSEPQGSPVKLTFDGSGIFNGQPSWSNNDKTIVFHSNRTTGDFDIWTISSTGGTPSLLTGNTDYGDYDPCYSKNGKYVAYAGFTLAASPKHSVNNKVSAAISENSLPTVYALEQNFPNPFNPSTVIRYALPENANVNLVIYDILGREVAELINGEAGAGYHEVKFDGSKLSSGIYFYKLTAGNFIQIKKMLLMK